MWPAASLNARLPRMPLKKKNGAPVLDKNGKPKYSTPSRWLDKHRAVEQMTWAPGEPQTIDGRLVSDGGWIERGEWRRSTCTGRRRLVAPATRPMRGAGSNWCGGSTRKTPTISSRMRAHRIQRPAEKINHGLV